MTQPNGVALMRSQGLVAMTQQLPSKITGLKAVVIQKNRGTTLRIIC